MDIFYESMSRKGIDVPADRTVLLTELKYTQRPHYSPQEHLPAEALIELYRLSARTADKHLQEFMDFLQSEGRAADTTLVFTADPGEHLNEHPDILQFTHMHPMYLEVLRIPLVIYAPGLLRGGTVISKPVQLADVMPTLLDLAGIGMPHHNMTGFPSWHWRPGKVMSSSAGDQLFRNQAPTGQYCSATYTVLTSPGAAMSP